MKMTESEVIASLRKLEKKWPAGLWLFSTGNSMSLMRTHKNGSRHDPKNGSMDSKLQVTSFNISNDGGDW